MELYRESVFEEAYMEAYEEAYREGYEEECREAREWYNDRLSKLVENVNEILDNFSYDQPSESVYKITGVKESGKTFILAKVEDELQKNGWLVFDINPARDTLQQIAAMLSKEGFSKKQENGGGFGYSTYSSDDKFFDIGIEVEEMIQKVQKKQKKILIGIDEIAKTDEMVRFVAEYGRWLRADYPVYLMCTGSYENIQELGNVKNLTFFKRAITIQTEPLQYNR